MMGKKSSGTCKIGRIACLPKSASFAALGILSLFCAPAAAGLHSGPQYDALIALYNSTNGASWTNKSGWAVGDACSWNGIQCDQDTNPSDNTSLVIVMQLGGKNMVGTLPSLAGLSSLQTLQILSEHQLMGSIPPLEGMSSLRIVWFADDALTGPIPSLTGLANLQQFIVFFNHLEGNIPSLSGLENLQEFSADSNNLTGSIPALTGVPSMMFFNASRNRLTGPIPELSGLSSLQIFDVSHNQLSGPIPSLTGLDSLQALYIRGNQLTGAVPVAPTGLTPGHSTLCPNNLDTTQSANDAAWDTATGVSPWWAVPYPNNKCDDTFTNGFGG